MAVTKSWESPASLDLDFQGRVAAPERRREFWFLLAASLLVACALALVLRAKTEDFADLTRRLNNRELIDLNTAKSAEELSSLPVPSDRIWSLLEQHRPLPNVGTLARLHLPLSKIKPLLVVRTPQEFL